jgi:class 3 adenylate cyclase
LLEDRVYHPDRTLYPLRRTGPNRLFARLGATRMLWELCGTNGGEGVEMMMGDGPTMIPEPRSPCAIEHGRFLAEHIAGAKLVELAGSDWGLPWQGADAAVDHIEQFLGGLRRPPEPTRVLATVLFTDIVGSTERAGRLGDRRWRELLAVHDELAHRVVEEFQGRLVKTTGDGILATFDGPGRGIRCAAALRDELAGIDLPIRAGLHTGEVELRDSDIGGIAVHLAARVMAAAGPGEILTSRTVRDLVVGSNITVDDRGAHALKGIDGTWQLSAVSHL